MFRVLNTCANDLREPVEEMGERCWELIAAHKAAVIAKPLPNAIVVEDSQCNGCFADPPSTNESDRFEAFSETDNLLD